MQKLVEPALRDRSLASVSWLADGADSIAIPVSETGAIDVARLPELFSSPVAYRDPSDGSDDVLDDGQLNIEDGDDDHQDDDPEEISE